MASTCKSFKPEKILDKHTYILKDGYAIYECNLCGHRFLKIEDLENHVEKVYSDGYFFEGGQGYPNYLDQKSILIQYGTNYANLLRKYCKPGKVLDVGCAAGFILKGYENAGWEGFGIDPNNTMVEYGKSALNLNLTKGDLESYKSNQKFDLISLIQVIGHLHDLDKSLETIRNLLNKDGYVIVESWDMNSLYARIMGKHWHEYSPPSVINWFSDGTLKNLFNNHGFELISKGRPSKKIRLEHGISLFKQSTPNFFFKEKIVHFLNRKLGKYTIPYPPFDLKWYIFKKQNNYSPTFTDFKLN
jgi:SAM-dependent methyltransferase